MKTLKKTVAALTLLALLAMPLLAQDIKRNAPKLPPAPQKSIPAPPLPSAATEPPLDPNLGQLKGIVILGSKADFVGNGVSGVKGISVKGPDFLRGHKAQVAELLDIYLGQLLTETALGRLQTDLILLCRNLDRPVVDVFYPPQEIIDGTVQVLVYEGRVGAVAVENEGKKWFSDDFIKSRVHLNKGDSISQKELLNDVNQLNQNPLFREVNVSYKQGKFDSDGGGVTDVDVVVKDRFPLRFFGGYDDYGLKILGEDRVFAGFNYGNVFGLDHQLNYQYTSDWGFKYMQAQVGSYVAPLPYGTMMLFGGYNQINADLGKIGFPSINNKGHTYQVSLRYVMPLPGSSLQHDLSVGFDFKSANTAVEFNKFTLPSFRTDVDQFAVEYHANLKDRLGYTQAGLSGYYSPGNLMGKNGDTNISTFRSGLKADYFYAHVDVERGFNLPAGLLALAKGGYQYASTRLLPSEQLGLGGYSLIRGYPEHVVSAEQGFYATAELHSPLIRTGNLTGQKNVPNADGDTLDLFAFFDYGYLHPKNPTALESSTVHLSSVGAGLNFHVSQNLTLNLAYGRQLKYLTNVKEVPAALSKDHDR